MEYDIRRVRPKFPVGELAHLLLTQPYLRIENVMEAGLAQRQMASKWLNELATTGLIAKEKIGRNVVYINQKLLNEPFTTPLTDQAAPPEWPTQLRPLRSRDAGLSSGTGPGGSPGRRRR